MENIEKLISSIVLITFGVDFLRYHTKFAKGALDSEVSFWRVFGKRRIISAKYQLYVKVFILVFGLLLLLGGVLQLYQFLSPMGL